jgi:hypothetical protein
MIIITKEYDNNNNIKKESCYSLFCRKNNDFNKNETTNSVDPIQV